MSNDRSNTTVGTACSECPFRRTSLPGYLGAASFDPLGFVMPHWAGEAHLPCHMQVDWEADRDGRQPREAPRCRGLLATMVLSCKLPKDPGLVEALYQVTDGVGDRWERERQEFMNLPEFVRHHEKENKVK